MSGEIAVVLGVNVVLSLLCWSLVWRLRAIERQIVQWAKDLDSAESQSRELLNDVPEMITSGVMELRSTQQRAQQLYQQVRLAIARLQTLRKVLNVAGTVLMWRRSRKSFSKS